MTSSRTFYRSILQVTVLSEEPYDPYKELDEIAEDITTGSENGDVTLLAANETIDGAEAARLLLESGSAPGYFRLTEDGEDVDDPDDPDADL